MSKKNIKDDKEFMSESWSLINRLMDLVDNNSKDEDLGREVRLEFEEVCQLRKELDKHDEEIEKLTREN